MCPRLFHRGNKIVRQTFQEPLLLQCLMTWIISPHALLDLWCNIPAKFHSNPCKYVGGVERQAKMCKNSKWQAPKLRQNLSNINYLPTCTSRLVVQHPCQVSFKSMQGCRRSWEDKLKCVRILSVKDHNSAKICQTWIISPHALLDLWYICTKFHSNPCKDVGGVEKTNFDVTEWRKDGMTDKANTKCPLAILWRGHNKAQSRGHKVIDYGAHWKGFISWVCKPNRTNGIS